MEGDSEQYTAIWSKLKNISIFQHPETQERDGQKCYTEPPSSNCIEKTEEKYLQHMKLQSKKERTYNFSCMK